MYVRRKTHCPIKLICLLLGCFFFGFFFKLKYTHFCIASIRSFYLTQKWWGHILFFLYSVFYASSYRLFFLRGIRHILDCWALINWNICLVFLWASLIGMSTCYWILAICVQLSIHLLATFRIANSHPKHFSHSFQFQLQFLVPIVMWPHNNLNAFRFLD